MPSRGARAWAAVSFEAAWKKTLGIEGEYSDNANDTGGKTRFGITERVARDNGYGGDMRALPLVTARRIAKAQYWDTLRLDTIDELSPAVACELFDTGYNAGIGTAGKFLQTALNAFNQQQKDYADVKTDGVVGPATLAALHAYLAKRGRDGETVLLRALNALQGAFYLDIARSREQNEAFTFGWFLHRVA